MTVDGFTPRVGEMVDLAPTTTGLGFHAKRRRYKAARQHLEADNPVLLQLQRKIVLENVRGVSCRWEVGAKNLLIWALILKKDRNGVCALWSVAEPGQNKKRKARPDKTEGAKRCVIARE